MTEPRVVGCGRVFEAHQSPGSIFGEVEGRLVPRSFLKTLRNYGSFCATLAEYRRFSTFHGSERLRNDVEQRWLNLRNYDCMTLAEIARRWSLSESRWTVPAERNSSRTSYRRARSSQKIETKSSRKKLRQSRCRLHPQGTSHTAHGEKMSSNMFFAFNRAHQCDPWLISFLFIPKN